MNTKIFPKEVLLDELDLPDNQGIVKSDVITDTGRWSIHHELVFEYNGKFYMTYYSVGATESQDEGPWEYDGEVECTEVELKEVMVKTWVPVE